MTPSELLLAILKHHGINPDTIQPNGQTALQFLEAAVTGALDQIEEEQDNQFFASKGIA